MMRHTLEELVWDIISAVAILAVFWSIVYLGMLVTMR